MLAHSDRGEGPSIVFAHGLGGDRGRWDPIIERLDDRFRCVAVDLPGHGESTDEGCNAIDATTAIHEVVRHLGLEAPTLVGHSLGATIALVYGAVYGPRSLVALDPVGLYLPDLAEGIGPFADRLRGDEFDAAFSEWEAALLAPVPEDRRAGLQAAIHPRQDVVLSYWSTLLDPEAARESQPGFDAAVAGIHVPALICLADPPSPADAAVLDGLSTATVEVYECGTHFLHLLDPDRFATRIADWVDALP